MEQDHIQVLKGRIHAYRLFDIGEEVNLQKARQLVSEANFETYRIRHVSRSLLINDHPLAIALPQREQIIGAQTYAVEISVKIWSFGAVSIRYSLNLPPISMEDLCEISWYLENDEPFHHQAIQAVQNLMTLIHHAITAPSLWSQHEDYLIFEAEKAEGLSQNLVESFINTTMASLILGEKPMDFAESTLETLRQSVLQYSKDDLTIVHWNGAFIYDNQDADDLALVLEFSLSQLLELRYYDDLLDKQLATLYQHIESQPHPSVLRNPYQDLSRKAGLQYIEFSEVIDRIGNSTKMISDYYYTSIYRAATKNMRLQDWKDAVNHKLKNIAEVSKIFQGEINEQRNQIMEFTIIVLIAIEVIPFVYSFIR